jgi:hypothetical protein
MERRRDLRDQIIKPRLLKHKMHMTRSPTMSPQLLKQFPHWSIIRYRIRHRHDALEPEHSFSITSYDRPSISLLSIPILHVIFAMTIGFPNIDLDVRDRVAGCCLNGAKNDEGLAVGVAGDGGTV